MPKTKQEIVDHIAGFITKGGGAHREWYVGITGDPRARLAIDHKVDYKSDFWTYADAGSSSAARDIEDYFVNTLGASGGTGGGDAASRWVYAYKKSAHTNP